MYTISQARADRTAAIVELLNKAYRGDESRKGWTTEADIIAGTIRTDEATVEALMHREGSRFFQCLDENGDLAGCVHVQREGSKMYLGMLSVQPHLQGSGIGNMLLRMAEGQARADGCASIYMQVIGARTELNEWYKRKGFRETGNSKPFDVDPKYGVPRKPLTFIYLEKRLE